MKKHYKIVWWTYLEINLSIIRVGKCACFVIYNIPKYYSLVADVLRTIIIKKNMH